MDLPDFVFIIFSNYEFSISCPWGLWMKSKEVKKSESVKEKKKEKESSHQTSSRGFLTRSLAWFQLRGSGEAPGEMCWIWIKGRPGQKGRAGSQVSRKKELSLSCRVEHLSTVYISERMGSNLHISLLASPSIHCWNCKLLSGYGLSSLSRCLLCFM